MEKLILFFLLLAYVHVDAISCNPDWISPNGGTCEQYYAFGYCDGNFGYGPNWEESWGLFAQHTTNGQSALVCPQCGCDEDYDPCTPTYTTLNSCGPAHNNMYCYNKDTPFCDISKGWCTDNEVEAYNFNTQTYYEQYDYFSYWTQCLAGYMQDWGCYGRCGFSTPTQSCHCNKDCELYLDCCDNYASACEVVVPGCPVLEANNFDPYATYDDGSCLYGIGGCTDPLADNYDPEATADDGSCVQECYYYEFQCGVFCSENTWTIVTSHNQEVMCEDVGHNGVGGCCLPEPHCGYSIYMKDSMEDGWNNGKLFINDKMYELTSGADSTEHIEAVNCEAIKNEGCVDPTATNYQSYFNWDDGSCEYEQTCSTCCSHAECPSGQYCAMGVLGDWEYNQCKVIDYCAYDNDSIDESCDVSSGTDTGNEDCDDNYNCCSHSDCDANEYCSLDDGYAACYGLADCATYNDAIDGSCPGSNTGGEPTGDCVVCCTHNDCDDGMYCANTDECLPLFECGQWNDEVSPCPTSDYDDTDDTDDGNNDNNAVYCTDCCSHDDCSSEEYCATAEYNGLPYTECYPIGECGQYNDEIEPCPGTDCNGVYGGSAVMDACEVCGGDGSSCNDAEYDYEEETEYTVLSSTHCGGSNIEYWEDGSSSNYGTISDLVTCLTLCDASSACVGFVLLTSSGVCGHWKQGPLETYAANGVDCYEKLQAAECLDYSWECGQYCSEVSWKLETDGSTVCSGAAGAEVESECCLLPTVTYTLTMEDSYGDGWNGGKLTIGGEEYTLANLKEEIVVIEASTEDCLGELGGSAVMDVCNVCDGDGQSCLDCNGVVNGNSVVDICGVCGGDGQSCEEYNYDLDYYYDDEETGPVDSAECLDYSWECGQYCTEVSWKLETDGSTVCSGAAGAEVESECCLLPTITYTLTMEDTYGDGWNGGKLTIGGEEYTLANGKEEIVEIGSGEASGCLDYSFVCGQWCEEVAWQLQLNGATICSGDAGPNEDTCCPEPINTYTLNMQDAYGDGWNGGKLTIGGVEYTLENGGSGTVTIAATEAGPAANTAYTVSSVASLSIGAGDDPNEAAGVAATAFGNTLGGAPGSTSYSILNRRARRQLGQALNVELTMTTADSSVADAAIAAASKPDFASSMASEMANVAAEEGVSVTVESLEASAPTQGTVATGCPSLAKKECKDDSTCDYDKHTDTCSDIIPGCPGITKKNACRDAGCSWIVDDEVCQDKLPGCAGHVKKTDCKDDSGCSWDKNAEACVTQQTGCGANGSKSKCWKDSELVCTWNFDSNKCVDGVCTGKEKSPCKKSPKCSWEKKDGDSKICYDAE